MIGFVLDLAIGEIFKACEETGYVMMVTADHGNAKNKCIVKVEGLTRPIQQTEVLKL